MQTLYFAYGSNLAPARMGARVPSAQRRGAARLAGYRLALDKRGRDGSAKANLHPDAGAEVWGALYALAGEDWPLLDACEGGYRRIRVQVVDASGAPREASTYRSQLLTDAPALPAYRRLILDGARAQGLPPAWIARLEGLLG